MGAAFSKMGGVLAKALTKSRHIHSTGPSISGARLLACLRPGDVLLVEGNSRVSTAIKYLTQSTWSHAALYVGHPIGAVANPDHCFVEADIVEGVRSVGIKEFATLHTRICRPFGMTDADCMKVAEFAVSHIGDQYDLRNVLDLARFFLPTPPIPAQFRRSLLTLGMW